MSTCLNVASVFHLINLEFLRMTRATSHLVRVVDQDLAGFSHFSRARLVSSLYAKR